MCDYRSDVEIVHKPDRPMDGIRNENIPVFKEVPSQLDTGPLFVYGHLGALGKPGAYMKMVNQEYVTHYNGAFAQVLELAQHPENLPLVQHCSSGKDRTGFGSAMLLFALGVPEETVMEDFMLSKTYTEAASQKTLESLKPKLKDEESITIAAAIYDVRKEYLQAAIDEINSKYGSVDQYLEQVLGLTKEKRENLRALLLE